MIDPITSIATQVPLGATDRFAAKAVPDGPSQSDINAFAAHLNRMPEAGGVVPEQQLIEQIRQQAVARNETIAQVMPTADAPLSAEGALELQHYINQQMKTVDIAAKVVGSVSQTVKQLLAMQ